MRAAEVRCGPVLDARGIAGDPHYQARDMLVPVALPDGTIVRMPGFVPKLTRTPGGAGASGPPLGAHNDEIYGELLGVDAEHREALHAAGVI